jgi:hypothetical protein
MTMQMHKIDDNTKVHDGLYIGGPFKSQVPAGWQVAPGDADDLRACKNHPWQCSGLVFADGSLGFTCQSDNSKDRIGKSICSSRVRFAEPCNANISFNMMTGQKQNGSILVCDGTTVRTGNVGYCDVLVRKRAPLCAKSDL